MGRDKEVATISLDAPTHADCTPTKTENSTTTTSFTCNRRLNDLLNDCARTSGWRKSAVIEAAVLVFCQAPDEWQLEAMKRAAIHGLGNKSVETNDLLKPVEDED